MFRRLSAIALFALFAAVAGFGPLHAQDNADFVTLTSPETPPQLLIEDTKSQPVDLKDFRGRYVLLNLWASWCIPCVSEMPAIDQLSSKLNPAKFLVVALNEDHDGIEIVQSFYQRHEITHLNPYIDADGRGPLKLHARGLPTTLLIDPNGMIISRLEGETDWSSPTMWQYLMAQTQR